MRQIQSLHLWMNALQAWHYPLIIIYTKEKMVCCLQALLYEKSEFYCIWTKEGMLLRFADTWYHVVFILNTNRKSAREQVLKKKAIYYIGIEKVSKGMAFTLSSPHMKTRRRIASMKEIDKMIIAVFKNIQLKKMKRNDII